VRELPAAIVNVHQRNNRRSAKSWDSFAGHRQRVTALALEAAAAGAVPRRLAVLGAGNCNDLDLAALVANFGEVHLVDLDGEALQRARQRQPKQVASLLTLHAPVDLSGALPRLRAFRANPATPAELAQLPTASTKAVLAALPATQRFDVVLSTCLLSQLMHSCYLALGPRHPQLQLLACSLALSHLRSAVSLLADGGTAVIVTDTVSSETCALDDLWDPQRPTHLLTTLDRTDKLLTGTSPSFLRKLLLEDQVIAPLVGPPRMVEPWLWRFSDEVSFLSYAMVVKRTAGALLRGHSPTPIPRAVSRGYGSTRHGGGRGPAGAGAVGAAPGARAAARWRPG
jgi:hypothetical protein